MSVTTLSFEKYQGLGNDFLLIEGEADLLDDAAVQALCDRHFGVGGDGVLLIGAPVTPGSWGRMVVRNADGSRPEMCGNGLRCVAAYLAKKRGADGASFVVDTDAGPKGCEVAGDQVSIGMGKAVLEGDISVDLGDVAVTLARVSMGNPHAVTFEPRGDGAFEREAGRLSVHPAFARGTNVEYCRQEGDGSIAVRVFERGVGPTLACGTGACAVAVQACVLGLSGFGDEVTVRLPGGPLAITITPSLDVQMRGPARAVFKGEVTL